MAVSTIFVTITRLFVLGPKTFRAIFRRLDHPRPQRRGLPQRSPHKPNLFTFAHHMPRVHANSSLRNRNRVTNKTRLKIIHGNIEADPLIYGEDDTPTGALFLNTHGVDAEDANVSLISLSLHLHPLVPINPVPLLC